MIFRFRSFDELPPILNARHLQIVLGVSKAKAYQILHRADFKTLQLGRKLLFLKDDLITWVDAQRN